MFKNYFLTALRNIKRHSGYSFINLTGLAVGMACCILIMAWVKDEIGTNRFHEKSDSLHIIRTTQHYGAETTTTSGSVPALGPALKAEFPEVRNAARIMSGQPEYLLEQEGRLFREPVQMADPQIFELFSFPLVRGNFRDLDRNPGAMILSETAAGKMFGALDPIGRTLVLDKNHVFRVAGVMKDIPLNSSIRFDIWMPLEMTRKIYNRPEYLDTWDNMAFSTYVEMAPGTDIAAFNSKIASRIRRSDSETNLEPSIYPFKDLYLKVAGRGENVRMFSIVAALILLIACLNFMNLATARSARRSMEVGLRKTVGAGRGQIMRQFFGESLIMTFFALLAAIVLTALFLPLFNHLVSKSLTANDFLHPAVLAGIGLVVLLTGILSGTYPAIYLSSFRPGVILKSAKGAGAGGGRLRKILVVFQFAVSGILIIGTIIIYSQVRFMKTKDLGFNREQLLYTRLEGALQNDIGSLKNEILRIPGIRSATASTHSPEGIYSNGQDWNWEGRDPSVNPLVTYFGVDSDFLETFGMRLASGQTFRAGGTALAPEIVINRKFADIMGPGEVLGKTVSQGSQSFQVAGIVENFHFMPVTREIEPIMIYCDPTYQAFDKYRFLFMRLAPGKILETLAAVENTVRARNPEYPFEYRFLDQDFDRLYRSQERESAILRTFALLAILISGLGLFGLAAFTAEQRRREIGIRKVLGATAPRIAALLSGEYIRWVLAANLIAWPVAYLIMKNWLADFPYRIALRWEVFAAAAAATLLISQLTVIWQTVRAARSDPAQSLRSE